MQILFLQENSWKLILFRNCFQVTIEQSAVWVNYICYLYCVHFAIMLSSKINIKSTRLWNRAYIIADLHLHVVKGHSHCCSLLTGVLLVFRASVNSPLDLSFNRQKSRSQLCSWKLSTDLLGEHSDLLASSDETQWWMVVCLSPQYSSSSSSSKL